MFIFASYKGYTGGIEVIGIGLVEAAAAFFHSSVYFYLIAFIAGWIGSNYAHRSLTARGTAAMMLFGIAVSMLVYNAAELVLKPDLSFLNFIISIAVGFVVLAIGLTVELKK